MNRRSFVAGVPALIPAIAFAQDATPEAESWPETLLKNLIWTLFIDRSVTDATTLLSPEADQDAIVLMFAKIIEWTDDRYGEESLDIVPEILCSESSRAITTFDLGEPADVFVFIAIITDGDGITGFRYSFGHF